VSLLFNKVEAKSKNLQSFLVSVVSYLDCVPSKFLNAF
jgi:uncharacterized protein (DUF927 family)